MKKLLILSLSLITFFGYSQTLIDPTLSPTAARINAALADAVSASGTDTYTGTKSGLTNVSGRAYSVTFTNANTGSATFNLNAGGAVTIRKFESGSLVNLVAGDISAGETKRLRYNGTYLVIEGGSGSGGGGTADFETMTGTPGAFSGNNLSYMRVSPGATQLEYRTPDQVAADIPAANTFTRGVLTAADWNTFNGKQSSITFGTGVQTALGVNVGTSGAPVINGGALGTPSSGVGTNITGIVGTNVINTPAGNIAATTSQAAINELDTEKASITYVDAGLATVSSYSSTPPEIVYANITGQTMEGRILSIYKSYRDIDGTAEGTTTYQWVRANDANGTGAADISGATSSTYTLVTGDLTKYIACKITPINVTPESGSVYTTAYVGAVDAVFYPASQSNVVLSYGLKKMASAYAGNCIQVQRTNGGATTDIGFDVNGDLDWAAVSTASLGGNIYLKIWYDQSGNGFNMVFASFANQPLVNYTNKRIEWAPTNSATTTHNSTMNIGTGDFSMFIEATAKPLKDVTFTYVAKKTSFSANNIAIYSPVGAGTSLYTGNGGSNILFSEYSTPDRRTVISAYRNSTTKYINIDNVIKSSAEAATDLTSTNDITYNSGDNGPGDWYMWSFTMYKSNYGADYVKYKKFVSAN